MPWGDMAARTACTMSPDTLLLGAGAHLNNLCLFLRLLLKTAGQIFHESQERNWERMADGKKKYGGQRAFE